MININVTYSNGQVISTKANGSKSEIAEYFAIGKTFNLGSGENDLMAEVVKIEFPDDTKPQDHPLYELCRAAYYNTSFRPEQRAESEVGYYEERLEEFKTLCAGDSERFEDIKTKFTSKFTAHMQAKSRCISSMITGPANFPVRRAEKANESERKRGDEVLLFVERVRKNFDKEKNPHKHGISSDDANAIELLKDKVARAEKLQADMKLTNKAYRAFLKNPDSEATKKLLEQLPDGMAEQVKIYKPAYSWEPNPFAPYQLTNNNADIKRLKGRIKELEARQGQETKELEIKGVRVVENVEDNRIQLFFDGRPEYNTIRDLKSHGMRWSPRNGCWQRMLNANGKYSVYKLFFPKYNQAEA